MPFFLRAGDCTHPIKEDPIKEDVKKKFFPLPLAGNQGVVTYIQPSLLLRGAFDVAALDRRVVQRRCQPQLIIPDLMVSWNGGARRQSVTKLRKPSVGLSANHHPI